MKYPGISSKRAAAIALSAGLVALGAACGSPSSSSSSPQFQLKFRLIELDYRRRCLPGSAGRPA